MPTPLGGNAAWSTPGFGGAQTPIATGTTTTTTTTTAGGGIPTSNSNEASPLPSSRTDTPPAARNNNMTDGNGNDSGARTGGTGSRAASVHPADAGAAATTLFTMPTEAPVHGAPVRQYINTKITGALLEGMKLVAKEQPENPLRMLGEFLLQRSKETEEPIAF
ncbi:hypothetical protein B0T24DRAFT_633967 [Lasiosphaeria ovina]|uniref:Dpy-30 domain-containing protein n=1 Tax=Lasiosphaeria ovina TaxID=92902 RepID=A0AAE0N1M5_9PEZI|nr:hypothetical protein B0T24DRAFT_633967 [Lasiosphaeria ovina]